MKVLSFDFGASSGRAILAELKDGGIELTELHRFVNAPVTKDGALRWDTMQLFEDIKTGIRKCVLAGHGDIKSIGIDTWGVDFGLLDKDGSLLCDPINYRDTYTDGAMEEFFKVMPAAELYGRTGIQFMRFNTVFQLFSYKKKFPDTYKKADKLLFMPCLFGYLLTGKMSTEYTIASTGALLDVNTGELDLEVLKAAGASKDLFPPMLLPGASLGGLKPDLAKELGLSCDIPVTLVCGHDTASAVVGAPITGGNPYISCGTWSLLGIESKTPCTNKIAYKYNFTNEGGYNKTIRLLKNISGLWLLQESRRQWEREGGKISFSDISKGVAELTPKSNRFDVDADELSKPGDLPSLINAQFERTGQPKITDKAELAAVILKNLAESYAATIGKLQELTGLKYNTINIIGGGAQDENLMQYTADAAGIKVIAGPYEATALGNAIVQLLAVGAIKDMTKARAMIRDTKVYLPKNR